MCGLAGFVDVNGAGPDLPQPSAIVAAMADALAHRGPDDRGVWVDEHVCVALGHRRLAVLDLSPEGHQPMFSACGRYVLVFNGEIYNFRELRRELGILGQDFRGQSDTEVMLAGFVRWGVEAALPRFVGMFAFALWDRQERILHLGRDRLGEKPLYYGWHRGIFLFASELKALKRHPAFRPQVDRNALSQLLRYNYVPWPYSIYQGIYKLAPGTLLSLNLRALGRACRFSPVPRPAECSLQPRPYWSAKACAEAGVANRLTGSAAELTEHLDVLLRLAVKQQMVADVPLGAFLSGGIDSSAIVALMQAQSERPVKTFTIGFAERRFNEAQHAKAVARHLGTDHTELYVKAEDALAVIPELASLYDEPFSDSSQVPMFLVSKLAREHVTVCLSGDGGDELFAGYNRYLWGKTIWGMTGCLPSRQRARLARFLTAVSPAAWDRVLRPLSRVLPAGLVRALPGDSLHKLAEIIAMPTRESLYLRLRSHWKHPSAVVPNASEPPTVMCDGAQQAQLAEFVEHMMFVDTVSYLPDDILTKVDRAAMGVGLETRVPLLDHRVVEFAWRLPLSLKLRCGERKWVLRQLVRRYLPEALIDRPKMGFGIPLDSWLRGPLRAWAESLLNERRLAREGFFDPAPIRSKWDEHLSGRRNWHYYLWDVLMFQAWYETE